MNKRGLDSIMSWIFCIISYDVVSVTIGYYEPITEIRLEGELSIICGLTNYDTMNFYIIDRNVYTRQTGHEFKDIIINNDGAWKIKIDSLCKITETFIVKELNLTLEQKANPNRKITFPTKYILEKHFSSYIDCNNLDMDKFKFHLTSNDGCIVVIKLKFIQFDADFANTSTTEFDCDKFLPSTLLSLEKASTINHFSKNGREVKKTIKPSFSGGEENQMKISIFYGGNLWLILFGILFAVCLIAFLLIVIIKKVGSDRNRLFNLRKFLTTNEEEIINQKLYSI